MTRRAPKLAALWAIVAVQAVCGLFFVWDMLDGIIGLGTVPIAWELRELIEIGAGVGLIIGVGMGAVVLARTTRHNIAMEETRSAAPRSPSPRSWTSAFSNGA